MVDVRVFVEVVAVLADVVQLGVERGVVLAPARPPVSLTEMSIRVIRIIPKQALVIILIHICSFMHLFLYQSYLILDVEESEIITISTSDVKNLFIDELSWRI